MEELNPSSIIELALEKKEEKKEGRKEGKKDKLSKLQSFGGAPRNYLHWYGGFCIVGVDLLQVNC